MATSFPLPDPGNGENAMEPSLLIWKRTDYSTCFQIEKLRVSSNGLPLIQKLRSSVETVEVLMQMVPLKGLHKQYKSQIDGICAKI
jgi:hypothetical protein